MATRKTGGDRIETELALDIYARVSRLGDKRQRPIQGQVQDCKARVADRGAKVGKVFDNDRGRSAWNPRVKRPDWDELMERLETGLSNGVVVFDLARFSRRPIEGERLIAAAERGLLILDSEDEYDLTSASGKKAFRDQLNTAAYESDRLSTRSARGKRLKAMSGEPNNSRRAFGFEDDQVTHRKDEAEHLRDWAKRVLAGETQDDLVVELNKLGIRTSTGAEWSRASLRQVLTRERNAGLIVHKGVVVSKLPGDPILDEETYDKLQSLFASRRRGRPNSEAYLCSGNVHCGVPLDGGGVCGHKLTGRPRKNMKPYPDGEPKRQYWCQPRSHNGGCGRLAIDQRELDRHVGALAVHILADPRNAAAIEAATKVVADRRNVLEAELAECEQLAEQLADRLGRREIKLARYDAAMKPLNRQIDDLTKKLDDLDEAPAAEASAEMAAASLDEWKARWEAAKVPERRLLLRRALRGRRLVIKPADLSKPRKFDPDRVVIED